ncbi:UDP-N-acetylmuramoyl-tripeptide--D-alanyl-D-alanine ligase [Desulfoluna spongiiphila]|uniref:UDP-N-acetylmuramoyl-tripeptide--D-alanyl-D-alanine ligase n=1 Tax=Desulfoluna spongiiphila TaxID=419481 RepID=A0A1G5AC05_9BACT|nr:UDP-N-acetylmuramoyl-tripeptide--D-alanyl-D-alanine ligase [Desulfoluna spongiiphila]SCX75404.1 UDP-N-acetylmuramoyl-tripeptide--D-alanyl-D-alanine ligase [Desulfoluna spongiiphila]
MPWSTGDVLAATGGKLAFGDPNATHASVSTNSRTIEDNSVFVALKGPSFDGHRYIDSAIDKGSRCIVAASASVAGMETESWQSRGVSLVLVDDTLAALGRLGRFRRDQSEVRLIAITGSNGKTTTRALTASVLGVRHPVHATRGNFNNEVGLPTTLLDLAPDHRWAVVELGMNAPGEMTRLGRICRADIAVITCIGEAHLEGLGTVAQVAAAKAELLDTLDEGATVILNGDDPHLRQIAADRGLSPVWYGFCDDAHVRAENISWDGTYQHFTLCHSGTKVQAAVPLAGTFMVQNALAAAAAGLQAGLSLTDVAQGLETASFESGRLTIQETASGIHVIDDTYNANPLSMEAALTALSRLKGTNRALAVLGDMRELGEEAPRFHRELGAKAAESGIAGLYTCGEFAGEVRQGALGAGLPDHCIHTGEKDALIQRITHDIHTGDWILVKGSRSMGMEQIVNDLLCR